MGWDVGGTGFRIVLSADVADVVESHLGDDVTELPRRPRPHRRRRDDVGGAPRRAEGARGRAGRAGAAGRGAAPHPGVAWPRSATCRRPRCCTCSPTRWPGRSADARGRRPCCWRWVRASAPSWCCCGGDRATRCTPVSSSRWRLERVAELRRQRTAPALGAGRGRRRVGAGPLPGDGRRCTPACWSGALVEVLALDRPFLPWLGWPMLVARRRGPGAALVVHPHARARSGTPGSSSCRACRRCRTGPYRWLRHPNYVAVVVGGVRAAAGAHRVGHRARLHRAQRVAAARADPRRERGPALARRTGSGVSLARPDATSSSPAAARSGWPPRCWPATAGLSVVVVEPRSSTGRQGLRRGADAGRRRRPGPARGDAGRPAVRRDPATSAAGRSVAVGVPRRPRARRPPDRRCTPPWLERADAAGVGAADRHGGARRAGRGRRDRGGAARSWLLAADGLHSTGPPPARPASRADAGARALRAAPALRGRALDGPRRGALVRARRGLRHPGRRRPGRRRRSSPGATGRSYDEVLADFPELRARLRGAGRP